MADPAEEIDDQDDPVPDDEDAHGLRARLKEQSRRRREAEAKLADTEPILRENALFKAGLSDLNEDQVEVLFAKGNLDQEALQARAKSLFGAVPAAGSSTTTTQQAETNDALSQAERFAAGGTSVETPPPALQAFEQDLSNFEGSREELMDLIFVKNAHLLQS